MVVWSDWFLLDTLIVLLETTMVVKAEACCKFSHILVPFKRFQLILFTVSNSVTKDSNNAPINTWHQLHVLAALAAQFISRDLSETPQATPTLRPYKRHSCHKPHLQRVAPFGEPGKGTGGRPYFLGLCNHWPHFLSHICLLRPWNKSCFHMFHQFHQFHPRHFLGVHDWLVVWNMFYFPQPDWGWWSNLTNSYFSRWLLHHQPVIINHH